MLILSSRNRDFPCVTCRSLRTSPKHPVTLKYTMCVSFVGSALYLIRLPAMNLEEFANSAAQTGILTHQETIDVFLHFTASNKPLLCFPTKPRQGLKTQVSEAYCANSCTANLDVKSFSYFF